MTISISISPKAEARLREKAVASGQPIEDYVSHLVERVAGSADIDELLGPFRKGVADSGMTSSINFFEDLRDKALREPKRVFAPSATR